MWADPHPCRRGPLAGCRLTRETVQVALSLRFPWSPSLPRPRSGYSRLSTTRRYFATIRLLPTHCRADGTARAEVERSRIRTQDVVRSCRLYGNPPTDIGHRFSGQARPRVSRLRRFTSVCDRSSLRTSPGPHLAATPLSSVRVPSVRVPRGLAPPVQRPCRAHPARAPLVRGACSAAADTSDRAEIGPGKHRPIVVLRQNRCGDAFGRYRQPHKNPSPRGSRWLAGLAFQWGAFGHRESSILT